MSTFILVDLANLFHRCRHVTSGDIETKAGMTLHIILNSFRQMHRKFHADHIVVCLEGKSWRREIYPQYKANRRVDEALVPKKELEENAYFQEVMNKFIDFLHKRTNVTMLATECRMSLTLMMRLISIAG